MQDLAGSPPATFALFLVVSWLIVRLVSPATPGQLGLQVGLTCLVLTSLILLFSQDRGATIMTGFGSAVLIYAILRLVRRRSLRAEGDTAAALSLQQALEAQRTAPEEEAAPPIFSAGPSPRPPRSEPPGASPLPEPPPLPTWPLSLPTQPASDRPGPTTGMRVAGLFLLINAGLVLMFARLIAANPEEPTGLMSIITAVVADSAIGAGLLSGRRFWKVLATGRAAVTALIYGLITPISEGSVHGWMSGVSQIILSIGFVYLVHLEGAERRKIALGIAAIALSWVGDFASGVVHEIFPSGVIRQASDLQRRSTFADPALGLRLDLPSGWALLPVSSPPSAGPEAGIAAFHDRSGTTALFAVEPRAASPTLDAYLDDFLRKRRTKLPSVVDVGRENTQLAGREARRMHLRWQGADGTVAGVTTVCRDDTRYYNLSAWGPEAVSSLGLRAYLELARGLVIAARGDDRPETLALRLTDRIPTISLRGARLVVEETQRRGLSPKDTERFGSEALRTGLMLLRPAERRETERLMKSEPSALSFSSRQRLRTLGDKAIEAALRQGKAAEQGRSAEPGRAAARGAASPSPTPSRSR